MTNVKRLEEAFKELRRFTMSEGAFQEVVSLCTAISRDKGLVRAIRESPGNNPWFYHYVRLSAAEANEDPWPVLALLGITKDSPEAAVLERMAQAGIRFKRTNTTDQSTDER